MTTELADKTILVTGTTSGMGNYIATELAGRGATLLIHGRDQAKLERTAQDIQRKTGNNHIRMYLADFASLRSVKDMGDAIAAAEPKLDVLINNAGIGGGRPFSGREISQDGYELRFAVNYLAPYVLTHTLLSLMKKSAPSRIVNVASAGQQPIDFANVMLEQGYGQARAYMQSKLAIIMMTFDLADELVGTSVTVNALHPATFMNTKMVRQSFIPPTSTVRSGAEPTIRLAIAPELQGITGRYFDQTHESHANSQAYDHVAREELRMITERLVQEAIRK